MGPDALKNYEAWERLSDGRPVLIRAIRPGDKEALQDGMRRLSPESAYMRFFQAKRRLSPEELVYYTEVDFQSHVALAAVVQEGGGDLLVGTGRYVAGPTSAHGTAEVAFTVDNAHQGLGVATLFLRHLSRIARASGLSEFRAEVIADNRGMLEVFSRSALPMETRPAGGMVEVRLSLSGPDIP
jgi:GNAT superfamily N-acetyltransferase